MSPRFSKTHPPRKQGSSRGDVILEFDGKEIKNFGDLSRIVAATPVGKTVALKIFRNGKTETLQVTVAEMQEKAEVAEAPSGKKPLGLTVQNITPEIAQGLGLKESTGVVVTAVDPGSPAAEAAIRRGDVIMEVNRQAVENTQTFNQLIESSKSQESILFLIRRGEASLFVAVSPK